MSLTIYGLRDSAGVEVFRGTIDPPPGGGSQPGIVQGFKATFGFADFTDSGGGFGLSPVAYTLEPGVQLLFATTRITEAFDDSGEATFFVASEAGVAFGSNIGGSPFGPGLPTTDAGMVSLSKQTFGAWDEMHDAKEVATVAVDIYVGANLMFDGTTGEIEVTFYVATPEAL